MQSKTPLLMVTALVCGLGAAFGTWKLVSGAQSAPPEDTMVKVLVPVADIPSYHLFADKAKFTEKDWPKSKLRESVEDTITTFDQIKGKTSRHYKLRLGEPVYKNDICDSMDNDIAERLKPGEVAEGIPVSHDDGGGYILVGDRVDIASTVQSSQGEPTKTMYILEAIEVLAVDNQSQKMEATPGQITPPSRFVLRVTRPQALVLRHFKDTARISIFKRRIDDPQILGEGYVFTIGKKPSTAQRYQEESPEATQQVALQISEQRLPDPTDDHTKPVAASVINKEPGKEYDERTTTEPVRVKLNDSGTDRIVNTKESFVKSLLVERKKEDKKDDKDGKKDGKPEEKKNNSGN